MKSRGYYLRLLNRCQDGVKRMTLLKASTFGKLGREDYRSTGLDLGVGFGFVKATYAGELACNSIILQSFFFIPSIQSHPNPIVAHMTLLLRTYGRILNIVFLYFTCIQWLTVRKQGLCFNSAVRHFVCLFICRPMSVCICGLYITQVCFRRSCWPIFFNVRWCGKIYPINAKRISRCGFRQFSKTLTKLCVGPNF